MLWIESEVSIVHPKTKVDLVEGIVLKYAENNANILSNNVRQQLRQEIITVLYQVSAQTHPVIDVLAECKRLGVTPPKLKSCPFCGTLVIHLSRESPRSDGGGSHAQYGGRKPLPSGDQRL